MKKVAIVGAEEHTRDNAPWDDESFDIWVVNEWPTEAWVKRFNASLDIHWSHVYTNGKYDRGTGYWEWLQQERGIPIYMQDVDPRVPDSVRFPLQEINAEFMTNLTYEGQPVQNYKTSVSYLVALALFQGYEQIDTYGIELAGNEYKGQNSNFAFWVGLAIGRGVKIDLHCSRGMFDAPLYGYQAFVKNSKSYDYVIGLQKQISEKQREFNMLEGALQLAEQMLADEQKDDEDALA